MFVMRIGISYDLSGIFDENIIASILQSASEVAEAVKHLGYEISFQGDVGELFDLPGDGTYAKDLFFDLTYPGYASQVPQVCQAYQVAHVGSGPGAQELLRDRQRMMVQARKAVGKEVKFPKGQLLCDRTQLRGEPLFEPPYMAGPRRYIAQEEQLRTCMCDSWEEVEAQAEKCFRLGRECFVEEFIDGAVTIVPLLKHGAQVRALGSVTVSGIDTEVDPKMRQCGEELYYALGLKEYATMVFVATADGDIYFMGADAMVLLGKDGPLAVCMEKEGGDYSDVIRIIIDAAVSRSPALLADTSESTSQFRHSNLFG